MNMRLQIRDNSIFGPRLASSIKLFMASMAGPEDTFIRKEVIFAD
jgi:hypothetical protein